MTPSDAARIEQFITRWQNSSGNERANYQMFFSELCDALGVKRPDVKGSVTGDPYCFDKDITIYHPSGKKTPGYIDFYKADHFLIEAKQGSEKSGKGTAKRGTNTYLKAMEAAFVQAIAYTRNLLKLPPFLLTCDIGDHFELWMGFSGDYGGYGARQDIGLTALRKPEIFDLFVDIFTDPQKRNPEKIAAKVTREVAADLAELSKRLEGLHEPEEVAHFLMRCIFTMFAEDVGLLNEHLFTEALETRWLLNPKSFKPEVEALWQAMNDGTSFGFYGRLLKFNGGLFAEARAFELTADQLRVLLTAAKREWKDVEPAIFGTLLERALDSKERSKLGAHYTPRSYVERLVRPVVMEPLREQWDLVQGEVKQILGDAEKEPTAAQKKKAVAALEGFLTELRQVRILDPACGSGNFLYVTLDLMKQLESEVLRRLEDVTGQAQLRLDIAQVNPSQFLGIELNPRAAAIADLVIWIGYLQWHFRQFGDIPPVEPVLREYKNIECRDAVLAYDGKEEDVDPKTGKVRTRWGGRMMKHPVTGEMVPDPSDQIPIYRYINPRAAEWQEADYIVSNPPFIGNRDIRETLGDGYAEALRKTYNDVPDTVDYVMYWWHKGADLIRLGKLKKFGFITTNTIRQIRQRVVIDHHQNQKNSIKLIFAVPDHPWTNEGAAVRIAMTGVELNNSGTTSQFPLLGRVVNEPDAETPEDSAEQVKIQWEKVGQIFSELRAGVNVASVVPLKAQSGLCCDGVKPYASGFVLESKCLSKFPDNERELIHPYRNGRDLATFSRNVFIIDCFKLTEEQLQNRYSTIYQYLLDKVYPDRLVERDNKIKSNWWLFERNRPELRKAIKNINRYICTVKTSKHRVFAFLESQIIPDQQIVVVATANAYILGVLSSRIHVNWALAAGGTLEDRPRYNNSVCFDPFPFPDPTPDRKQKIRELGERLDAHRKRVQAQHPDVTITAMYNLLEKIRAGEELTDKDREFNNKALISTLKQIHDELDSAVFEAYGWSDLLAPPQPSLKKGENADGSASPLAQEGTEVGAMQNLDEMILERLVALNAERAEEERNGFIRWLRPEYQAPGEVHIQQVIEGIAEVEEETAIAPVEQQKFPKAFKDQLAAVRDLLRTQGGEWTVEQIAAQFKGASRQKQIILTCLESLEALGIIAKHQEEGSDRWYLAELQKAS
ncbi:class I SAM-dependent DNA methyltransferase [Trichocoleus sp. FACHB-90]|uniref:class I SAM-dependent DNA methyltransferase n=1 Tax=Cyanophyceae TaxID=3028117 RepID=UPI001683A82A|nr:class I SAM-dependent DNA methyltransferase [Trichocoleus sp. FACHB-90]MBD1926442.1 class I SAM-dependent DNA methyltransferase [Trichocoleus sp. FACHB-90]